MVWPIWDVYVQQQLKWMTGQVKHTNRHTHTHTHTHTYTPHPELMGENVGARKDWSQGS